MKRDKLFHTILKKNHNKQICQGELGDNSGTTTVTKVINHYHKALYLVLLSDDVFNNYISRFSVVTNMNTRVYDYTINQLSFEDIVEALNSQLNNEMLNVSNDLTQSWFPKNQADEIVKKLRSDPFNNPSELNIREFIRAYAPRK